MQILRVDHTDFTLVIECNNLESTFNKASKRQTQIFNATSYSVNEGELSIYNFESRQLEKLIDCRTYPLIFENKDYFIGITFKDKAVVKSPYIYSKLKEVEEKFFYREELGFLAGTINFGNDLGKSHLEIRFTNDNLLQEINLEFEVFPTKLNYRSDYEKIVSDIEKEYPYLVLDFLKKTYKSFKTGNTPNTDLIWWQVFGGLYADFLHSSKFILNKPHSRIIRQTKYLKADRIQKWTSALEEEYSQFKSFPNKNYRSEYKTLSSNTSENRFFKHAVFQTLRRYKKVKSFIERRFSNSISENFKSELSQIEKQLKIISINPFFRTIDDFHGIKQESLVLQKATGYSTIYKSWIMLNSGLKFLDGIQKIELKNIADLYQIWCFLEIKNVLQNLLGKENPDDVDLAEIQIDDFVFKIERGVKSKVSFFNKDGEKIDLFHDFSYNTSESQNVKSFTVNQRPDIVLRITKNDLKENYVLTYLYDAKYRLASDDREGSPDLPTEDSINQMHRYRDAIYYVNKDKVKPEKEVIGAYILFPGSGEIETIKKLDYYKSIESVNIGAFPLRPNDYSNRALLEDHLRTIIGLDTESILNDVSPQKESAYESPNPFVLIGFVPSEDHMLCFTNSESPFYYSGKSKPTKFGFKNLKYFAPYIKEKGVREYYEIVDYQLIPRKDIFKSPHPLFKNEEDERLLIRLGQRVFIDNGKYLKISDGTIGQIPYRYTNLLNIRTPHNDKIKVLKVS
ncbi:DUF2357 domain-containing protein [Jiulongibacter sediminis]|uniref:DUF2357 domain-containing protein n=1 Tax=Jiulongibacter sediminis TaxID=1605367 RepID=A0A0P7BXP7_9BACT|nr:DUF2357 domain-containing protein [Jiulongibacter sediminis]KPM49654.1 hypothetical protein AFM12_03415 [Jiulongibacter sediminis]TBX26692.1 hypothetical protein TK44_03420 [Jiulongibacter sediminis]